MCEKGYAREHVIGDQKCLKRTGCAWIGEADSRYLGSRIGSSSPGAKVPSVYVPGAAGTSPVSCAVSSSISSRDLP